MIAFALVLASTPQLGLAAGACRPDEPGPAIVATIDGLIDRKGLLRLELYPAVQGEFLADDNVLIAAGKAFARVNEPVSQGSPVTLCIRAPKPGRYALALLHDRDGDHRFGYRTDGIGFPGNPAIGWSQPAAAAAALEVGPGITRTRITVNYLHGLHMRPLAAR